MNNQILQPKYNYPLQQPNNCATSTAKINYLIKSAKSVEQSQNQTAISNNTHQQATTEREQTINNNGTCR